MSFYDTFMDRIAESPFSDELSVSIEELYEYLEWLGAQPWTPPLTPEPDVRVWKFRGRKLVVRL